MPSGTSLPESTDTAAWTRDLQVRLDQTLVEELAGLSVERIVEAGDPALRIVDVARARSVDLIMMPTHGVGRFRRMLLGSVTAKVLHDATCPVWTAAHAEEHVSHPLPRTILCSVDGSPRSSRVLQWAAVLSTRFGATLQVLHVVAPITDWPALERERLLQDHVREERRAAIEALQKAAGVVAPLRIAVGEIVATVTEAAREANADVLVVGRGVLTESFGALRTHEYGIIQRSSCPVVSV
jgi:nucleotide-binding universal stress UspA family protein